MKEKILKKGAANWFHGIGSKGGHLILTSETLYFEGHNFNTGKKEFEVDLENILSVEAGGFLSNNLIIITNKSKETFAVNGKKNWVEAINSAIEEIK